MSVVPLIEYESASPEVRAVYDDIMATGGTDWINNFWKALAHDPALLRRTWESIKEVMAPGALDPLFKEMVYVTISTTNNCEYCIRSHTAGARAKGMTDEMLMELLAVVSMANETNRARQRPPGARPRRTEMQDRGREHVKDRAGVDKGGIVGADQQDQFAGGGGRWRTVDRTVDEGAAALRCGLRRHAHMLVADGAAFDRECAGLGGGKRTGGQMPCGSTRLTSPAATRQPAMPLPILPGPRNAILVMFFFPLAIFVDLRRAYTGFPASELHHCSSKTRPPHSQPRENGGAGRHATYVCGDGYATS